MLVKPCLFPAAVLKIENVESIARLAHYYNVKELLLACDAFCERSFDELEGCADLHGAIHLLNLARAVRRTAQELLVFSQACRLPRTQRAAATEIADNII